MLVLNMCLDCMQQCLDLLQLWIHVWMPCFYGDWICQVLWQ